MYISTHELGFHLTLAKARKYAIEGQDLSTVIEELKITQENERKSIQDQYKLLGTKLSKSTPQSLKERTDSLEKYKLLNPTKEDLEKYDRERLGVLFLNQIQDMLRMPSFSGYSENWSNEFRSQAILNLTSYAHNFCVNKISKRTNKSVSAFAYTTQIIFNSFISVINREKANSKFIQTQIEESNKAFGAFVTSSRAGTLQAQGTCIYGFNQDIVQQAIEHNERTNNRHMYLDEIERLQKNVPQSKRTSDYKLYIQDLEQKAQKYTNEKDWPDELVGKILLDDATHESISLGLNNNIEVVNVPTDWT